MQRRFIFLLGIFVLMLASVAPLQAASRTVWSGLVMANNVETPDAIPAELNPLEGTLKNLFGYNQFKVIGQSRKSLVSGSEDWLASSKYFALHVDSKRSNEAGYLLTLKLFQEKNLLLETDAKLSKASPLVIKGPQVGDGQLLLVLVVQ